MGGVVCGEGPCVEDDGVLWRGETVGEDVCIPSIGGGGAIFVWGVVNRGRCGRGGELWECREGAYGTQTEVVLHVGAEFGEVGECACEIVGVVVGVERKVEVVVVVHGQVGRNGGVTMELGGRDK